MGVIEQNNIAMHFWVAITLLNLLANLQTLFLIAPITMGLDRDA